MWLGRSASTPARRTGIRACPGRLRSARPTYGYVERSANGDTQTPMSTHTLFTTVLLTLLAARHAAAADEVLLAADKQARLPIVVGQQASERTKAAAQTLADYLGRISGAAFTVTHGDGAAGLVVGVPADFTKLPFKTSFPGGSRGREDYLLRSAVDPAGPRGPLWGRVAVGRQRSGRNACRVGSAVPPGLPAVLPRPGLGGDSRPGTALDQGGRPRESGLLQPPHLVQLGHAGLQRPALRRLVREEPARAGIPAEQRALLRRHHRRQQGGIRQAPGVLQPGGRPAANRRRRQVLHLQPRPAPLGGGLGGALGEGQSRGRFALDGPQRRRQLVPVRSLRPDGQHQRSGAHFGQRRGQGHQPAWVGRQVRGHVRLQPALPAADHRGRSPRDHQLDDRLHHRRVHAGADHRRVESEGRDDRHLRLLQRRGLGLEPAGPRQGDASASRRREHPLLLPQGRAVLRLRVRRLLGALRPGLLHCRPRDVGPGGSGPGEGADRGLPRPARSARRRSRCATTTIC